MAGSGNDTLTLENAAAFAAFLYGGPDTNSLTTNAATRAGIRTLKYSQFQTRNRCLSPAAGSKGHVPSS